MTIEIDHTSLSVSDYEAAKKFYAAALKPLRVELMMEFPAHVTGSVDVAGLGADGKPFLWLANAGKTTPRVHLAFRAETRAQVDAFFKAAIAAGGTDNGPPGLRPMYHPNYYGAFVLDADGHNIEAVCHAPPKAVSRKKTASGRKATPARKRTAAGKKAAASKKRASAGTKTPSRKKPAVRGKKPAARKRKTKR
jgi:catechol 2,3-dioxygenase-like lactoylglutathione lyase family enzyme